MTVMEPLPPDPYKALGVGQDADISKIKTAYRKLALQCHPDKVLDPALKATKQDEFQRVQQAYEILSDENKKREYDDDVKLRKLREEAHKHASSATRPSPKNYYEYNVRTAEPPPSFRPGPPPAATARSPYPSHPQYSGSWDRDIPTRSSKGIYEEDRKARRAASYEKPRSQEETKEERRRREKAEDEKERRRAERERERERERKEDARREKQRQRERAEQRERDLEKERERIEKEKRKAEEKRIKKERERVEKENDKLRKQQQEDKFNRKTAPYVEDESEDDPRRKKTSGSSSKKHSDSPRREKSRREESPREEPPSKTEKAEALLNFAADYMQSSRRKGSKSGPSAHYQDPGVSSYSPQYRDPEEWHPSDAPRSRRPSHDDKYHARVEDEPEIISVEPQEPIPRPPRLQKSYTSPPGQMHMPNTSAPRVPHLSRAATMDTRMPAAPPPPAPESSRHSKSDRRRRSSMEDLDDRPRRSMATHKQHSYRVDHDQPRAVYQSTHDVYAARNVPFDKVKVQNYSHEPMYQSKRYMDADVHYSEVPHSAMQASNLYGYTSSSRVYT